MYCTSRTSSQNGSGSIEERFREEGETAKKDGGGGGGERTSLKREDGECSFKKCDLNV